MHLCHKKRNCHTLFFINGCICMIVCYDKKNPNYTLSSITYSGKNIKLVK